MNRACPCQAPWRAGLLVAALTVAAPGSASAVLPSPAEVLAKLASRAPEPATWQLWLEERPAQGPPTRVLRILAEVLPGPDGVRLRVRLDEQDLATGVTSVRVFPGPQVWPAGALWLRLLLGDAPRRAALDAGVRLERTSFARAGDEVLWVLGAGPQEPKAPQLQVERRSGRLRAAVEADGVRVDLEGAAGEAPDLARWPRRVTFRDADEARTYELTRAEKNLPLPPDAFGAP